MARCEACGNDYARLITVIRDGQPHEFDSFECAIQKLAPTCERCGIRILGHGVESGDRFYCGASCARSAGVHGAADHV